MGNEASSSHRNKKPSNSPMFNAAICAFDNISSDHNVIKMDDWMRLFNEQLATAIYRYFGSKSVNREDFVQNFSQLYELHTKNLFDLFNNPEQFVQCALECQGKSFESSQSKFLDNFLVSLKHNPSEFIDVNCPGLVQNVILRKIRNVLYPQPEQIIYATTSSIISSFQLLCVQAALPEMVYFTNKRSSSDIESCWHILYNSCQHGLSVNGFEGKVFGYTDPTVAIFKMNNGYIYVIANTQEWKHTTKCFGSNFSKCITISPKWEVFETRETEPIFCNFKYRTSAFGVGFKGAFQVNAAFDNVEAIEVWGCGDENTLKSQAVLKLRQRMAAERNKKVPLPGNWDENPDKAVLEMAGFKFSSERNKPEPPFDK